MYDCVTKFHFVVIFRLNSTDELVLFDNNYDIHAMYRVSLKRQVKINVSSFNICLLIIALLPPSIVSAGR